MNLHVYDILICTINLFFVYDIGIKNLFCVYDYMNNEFLLTNIMNILYNPLPLINL